MCSFLELKASLKKISFSFGYQEKVYVKALSKMPAICLGLNVLSTRNWHRRHTEMLNCMCENNNSYNNNSGCWIRQQQGKHPRNVEQTHGLSLTVIDTVYAVEYKQHFTRCFVCIMILYLYLAVYFTKCYEGYGADDYQWLRSHVFRCNPLQNLTDPHTALQHTTELHTTLCCRVVCSPVRLCRGSSAHVTYISLQHTTEQQACVQLGGVLQGCVQIS